MFASIYIKMPETFQKVLIKDDRIGNVTDAVKYGVFKRCPERDFIYL